MIESVGDRVSQSIQEALSRLGSVEHFRAGSIVSLPVLYPSGSAVALEIVPNGDRCLVSDRGGGAQEAELFGASRYFKREATRVAENAGIRFDGRDMFVADVSLGRLRGAMIVVANCSAEATNAAALRLSDRAERDTQDILYDRLSRLYKTRDVQRDPELSGETHKWRVSIAVIGGDRVPALFEPVSGAYISAVGTVAKFNDFASLALPPDRFSVMKSRDDLGSFYGLVARASTKLLPISASDRTFIELLEAA